MKAKGEIEALKTLTDFRKQAFSNAPRAGLRLGSPTALPCLPVVQRKAGKELVPHMREGVSGEPGPSGPVGDARRNLPSVRGGAPRDVPGLEARHGAGMIPSAARTWHHPVPSSPCLWNTALESAPHYANGKTNLQLGTDGGCAWFPWDLLSNCSEPI